ncbi:DUF58 domain-containing protein [Rhodobacteraceae bacterium 2376]|uniref:DUF58 domain-containing protein n=1 Tax=Rhabdonatronobacter sediminivivens TaxID=2743469 RepID=A0A7Z0HYY8_9RHOB|nr:DUF58 domain-containing protein [Rhabdonatronobacter sediminivivens]NYS24881.1 DUF58 domain-containing protein [Rhabdonatronobacter sediminivivens]
MSHSPAALRLDAESLAGGLPPLLVEAEHLAASVLPGAHGRRRAGQGDEFWQYRAATGSDPASRIDWRRSARSDMHFVRETEWQAAQAITLWVDLSRAMAFSGDKRRADKGSRARLLALALAVLALRAGERVGLMRDGAPLPARSGKAQLMPLTQALAVDTDGRDYGAPGLALLPAHSRAVFLSDFLGDPAPVEAALTAAADRGVRGALVQVLDPVEEGFPFQGRSIFESMGGAMRHETMRASDLRARYQDRLAQRKDRLAALARLTGWQFTCHHTDTPPAAALMWLWHALAPAGGR